MTAANTNDHMTTAKLTPGPPGVTRHEFEGVLELIRDGQKKTAREIDGLRDDIKSLATSSGRPQWQALTLSFTVFAAFMATIVGVWSSGQAANGRTQDRLMEATAIHQAALIEQLQKYDEKQDTAQLRGVSLSKDALEAKVTALGVLLTSQVHGEKTGSEARHEAQATELKELHRRAGLMDAWMKEHDFHVRGVNSAQDERLTALERNHFDVDR